MEKIKKQIIKKETDINVKGNNKILLKQKIDQLILQNIEEKIMEKELL